MKKILFSLIVIFGCSTLSASTMIDDIFTRFAKAEKADYVNMDSSMKDSVTQEPVAIPEMGFGNLTVLQVLDLEDSSDSIKEAFRSVELLDDDEYSTLIQTKDDDDEVRILMRKEGDTITEFIVIDFSDPAIVRMKGTFSKENLEKMLGGVNKKKASTEEE